MTELNPSTPSWLRVGSALTARFRFLQRANDGVRGLRDRWLPPGLLQIERAVGDASSLLEVGCGDNSPIQWFRHPPDRRIGVDLFRPSIERSRSAGIHTEYHELDVLEIDRHFEAASIDVVIALDLIEHLTRADGLALIERMERVARKRVVIFTPNGFLEQGEYGGNPWQVHHSGWTPDDFQTRGYRVNGLSGLKWLRGEYATPRWRPLWFWETVSKLTQPLAWRMPQLAYQLLAVKDIR